MNMTLLLAAVLAAEPLKGPEAWLELMGGDVRKDGLTLDLEAMKTAGFSGIHLFHIFRDIQMGCKPKDYPAHRDCLAKRLPCAGPEWDDMMAHVGRECERLGLGLTVQNCPGWSQSGGPWIDLDHCMREATVARRDFNDGEAAALPEIPERYRERDRDWRDIAVLAFPTPKDDDNANLKPAQVVKEGENRRFRFDRPVTVRSLVLPNISGINSRLAYEMPWMHVKLSAIAADGSKKKVLDMDVPVSNWRDYVRTMTFACEEATASEWFYEFTHSWPIRKYLEPSLSACARQTDWEGKSGLTLRSLERKPAPKQDAAAWVDAAKVVDLTDRVRGGKLDWTVPSGQWTVLRVGSVNCKYVNAPAPKETTGWECDKLDPAGIEANFNGYIGRLADGVLKGRIGGMLVDSWECFAQTWTPKMESYFRNACGYELRPHLPALFGYVLGDPERTESFLTDWRRLLGDLVTKNYFGRMSELAREKGLTSRYETAFGDIIYGDILEYWKYAEEPMCEYWVPHSGLPEGGCGWYAFKPVRPCASAAHIYGKSRVTAEAFTGNGVRWNEDFQELRDVANRHFARGVTHLAFQSYTHQPGPEGPVPGDCMGGWNGTPFSRFQTWWRHMPLFNGWLTRCEARLEEGLPAQDVLWYLGDAVDHKPDEMFPFPEGFRADYLNHDVLTNGLRVVNGELAVASGAKWKLLWVPDEYRMLPATRKRLGELATAGAKVVYGGKEALVAALAGTAGDVVTEPKLGDAVTEDFMWIHRRVGAVDRYFVAAGTNGYAGRVTFRAQGAASVYDPVRQTRRAWTNGTELKLARSESVFVEFNSSEPLTPVATPLKAGREVAIRNWTLSFPAGWDAPRGVLLEKALPWHDLVGLSRAAQAFSGTAVYEAEFDAAADGERLSLDLGQVETVAKVFVNGREVDTLWCEPFVCELKGVRRGRNALRVEVTSTWRNRVIYDLGLPEAQRKTWIRWRKYFNPEPTDPFEPAGLVGPVRLNRLF